MQKYAVKYGSGLAWLSIEVVEMDEKTTDYGAVLDKAVDQKQERGDKDLYTIDEIEEMKLPEDEYVIGGNHGLCLWHHGSFFIEEVPNDYVPNL